MGVTKTSYLPFARIRALAAAKPLSLAMQQVIILHSAHEMPNPMQNLMQMMQWYGLLWPCLQVCWLGFCISAAGFIVMGRCDYGLEVPLPIPLLFSVFFFASFNFRSVVLPTPTPLPVYAGPVEAAGWPNRIQARHAVHVRISFAEITRRPSKVYDGGRVCVCESGQVKEGGLEAKRRWPLPTTVIAIVTVTVSPEFRECHGHGRILMKPNKLTASAAIWKTSDLGPQDFRLFPVFAMTGMTIISAIPGQVIRLPDTFTSFQE